MVNHESERARKFRQAAIVYLHVGLLYEFTAWVMIGQGMFPATRGPAWIWLVFGAAITLAVTIGLWRWHNKWLARAIWGLHALRLPTLVEGAFFEEAGVVPPDFFLAAGVVVLVNLAFLARAGWDL